MNKKRIKKILKISAISIASFFVLIITGLFIITYFFSNKVTQIVINELNKNINTEVNVSNVEFSLFSKFPGATLEFKDITIKSSNNINKNEFKKINSDTLLYAKSLFLEFNIIDILKEKYIIKKIYIENGKINILTDSNNENNYNLWKESSDNSQSIKIKLNDVKISNTKIYYRNLIKDIFWKSLFYEASMSGNFGENNFSVTSDFDTHVNSCYVDGIEYITERKVKANIDFDVSNNVLKINKGNINIAGLKLNSSGSINYNNDLDFNLLFKGKNLNVKSFIGLLPKNITKSFENFKSDGNFYFDCKVDGVFNKTENPKIDINFGVDNGTIINTTNKIEVSKLMLKGQYSNGKNKSTKSSFFKFDNFNGKLGKSTFSGKANIDNFSSPTININSDLNLDLFEIFKFFKIDSVEKLNGQLVAKVNYSGKILDFNKITASDINNSVMEGNMQLTNFNFKHMASNYEINNCIANGNFQKNYLNLENLKFNIKNTDISFNGNIENILNYIFLENQKLYINGQFESSGINYNEMFDSDNSNSGFGFPKNIDINCELKVSSFKIDKLEAKNAQCQIFISNNKLIGKKIFFHALEGNATGDAIFEIKSNNNMLFQCSANLRGININSLFSTFDNFGQDFIVSKHLSGKLDATIDYSSVWDSKFNIVPESVICDSRVEISNGQLKNFEPMQRLSNYIELSELESINFSTLKNDILIKNKIIYIPQMDISSNAFNIQISGTHNFDNEFEYKLKVLLSEVLSKKAKHNNKDNEEFEIQDDGLGKTSLFLIIKGNPDNYKISYDTKRVKENIKENIVKEKQTLKKILNEEFGWFKNDTSITNKKIDDKKVDFNNQKVNIIWDESKPEKVNYEDD